MSTPFWEKIKLPDLKLGFTFRSSSVAGIDIGSDAVKVVQLKKSGPRITLETYGELKAERYFEKEPSPDGGGFLNYRDESIARLLTDLRRDANVTSPRTVFSIPSTVSFITSIQLPFLRGEELSSAVPYEAKKYIPIPLAEVALDWQVLEEDAASNRMTVLLAAVPREVVAKYQRVSERMKLELEAVEIENFSLVRSLLPNDRGVAAIVQWGAMVTTLTVADRGRIRASHNFGRGAREITSTIARSLGVTAERAEEVKRSTGLSEQPEARDTASIIAPIVDSILIDLERALAVYNRAAPRKVERIVLTGGGSSLAGLVDRVAKRFGLETTAGNPFTRLEVPPLLTPTLTDIAPDFSVAIGLALRQLLS